MSIPFPSAETLQRWDIIHRVCADEPGPINDLNEARRVLTTHAGHGCPQYIAALGSVSSVHG